MQKIETLSSFSILFYCTTIIFYYIFILQYNELLLTYFLASFLYI